MRRGTRSPLPFRKYAFSNVDRCDYAGCIYFAVMPILPKYHAPLRLATSDILLSSVQSGKLYGAKDIACTINNVADVTNNPSMFTKVDVAELIHAFANESEDDFVLSYDGLFWSHRGPTHAIGPPGNKTRATRWKQQIFSFDQVC